MLPDDDSHVAMRFVLTFTCSSPLDDDKMNSYSVPLSTNINENIEAFYYCLAKLFAVI